MRRALATLLAAAVVAGCAGGGRAPASALPPPPATAGTSRLRVGLDVARLPSLPPAELDRVLADAVATGATWVRSDLDWATVQPDGPAGFDWSRFDRVVAAVNRHRLHLVPILDYTPPWARPAGCRASEHCAPAGTAPFARFAAAAVARYAPAGVHTWEIWNEPNTLFWEPAPDPRAYAALVAAAVPAMRVADPRAYVITGGLAPAADGARTIAPRSFLTSLCRDRTLALVDGVGDHPYSFPILPSQAADLNAWTQMGATTPSLESILRACGAGNRPIWITEYGAPTSGRRRVSEQAQAAMVSEAVRLAGGAPYIAALFVFELEDTPGPDGAFGLRRANGSPKPAYAAFRDAIASLPPS